MGLIKKTIQALYPLRRRLIEATGIRKTIRMNEQATLSPTSFYDLTAVSNTGETISFDRFKGRYVLLVNLASECGYTPQYASLQELHETFKDKLVVLGFPSNDFGAQEPGTDEQIAEFCRVNYGVSFPLFQKAAVKGAAQQPVYQWLCQREQNGWNTDAPSWNFCKYLVNPEGRLTHMFSAAVDPLSPDIAALIQPPNPRTGEA